MATAVLMPRLSPTMEEGVIGAWLKEEGDAIEASELLCEIETDKASMEYESPEDGVLLKILVEVGKNIPVDTLIAIIAEEGEEVDTDKFVEEYTTVELISPSEKTEEKKVEETSEISQKSNERIKASPLAKSIAKQNNLDLSAIKGSGPNGRIIASDLENPMERKEKTSVPVQTTQMPAITQNLSENEYEDVKNSTMRNVIAKRLLESSQNAPEFFLTVEINMNRAIEFRKEINAAQNKKITFNDLVIKATALGLKKNPKTNASWLGDSIRYHKNIHISVAVAIEDGLITPVIRNADKCGLAEISSQVKELATKAKDKKLQPEEYTGGTFSVSNLGMFGIEQFTSILNPPESGIFAVGGIIQKPIVDNGEFSVGNMMKITMTCDHRVIDGATGAQLLKDVKNILENPSVLAI
jgi:pyruvate dehydrogenase E2 component (dihydrolipoamide acetyltransferase)